MNLNHLLQSDVGSIILKKLDIFERTVLKEVSLDCRRTVLKFNKIYGEEVKIGRTTLDSNLCFKRNDKLYNSTFLRQYEQSHDCPITYYIPPSTEHSVSHLYRNEIHPKMHKTGHRVFPYNAPTLFKKKRSYCFGDFSCHVKMNDVDIWPTHWAAFPGGVVHSRQRNLQNAFRVGWNATSGYFFLPVENVIGLPKPDADTSLLMGNYEEVYPLWSDTFHASLYVDSLKMLFLAGGSNTNLIQVHCYDERTMTFPRRFHLPPFAPLPSTGMTLAYNEKNNFLYVVGGVENQRKSRRIYWINLTSLVIPRTQEEISRDATDLLRMVSRVEYFAGTHNAMQYGIQLKNQVCWEGCFFMMKYARQEPIVRFIEDFIVIVGGTCTNGIGANVAEFIKIEGKKKHLCHYNVPYTALFKY